MGPVPDAKDACLRLTQILSTISNANIGSPLNRRATDAEGLGVKFIFHCISAQHLIRGTRLPEINASFNDPASINVVIRAALESVLIFHYVFNAGVNDDELNFRYDAWVISDLQVRQGFPVSTDEGKLVLAQDKEMIEKIRERLRINPHLKTLTSKQQKAVLKGEKWRFSGWSEMGRAMGLDRNHAQEFYGYLCSYSHSGYLSVFQVKQAKTAADQKILIDGSTGVLAVALANMITQYAKFFPRCEEALKQIPDAEQIVQKWIWMGANTVEA